MVYSVYIAYDCTIGLVGGFDIATRQKTTINHPVRPMSRGESHAVSSGVSIVAPLHSTYPSCIHPPVHTQLTVPNRGNPLSYKSHVATTI